jgi:hypothetical protein
LPNSHAAQLNQHMNKYCIALLPEHHHAVFTGRSSHLLPMTREGEFNYLKLVTELWPLNEAVIVWLQTRPPAEIFFIISWLTNLNGWLAS